MPGNIATLATVLADIRRAYTGREADVPPVLAKYLHEPVDVQINLFAGVARERWIADAVDTIRTAFPVGGWWSALRRIVEQRHKGPAHSNWWGGVASGLRAAGWSQAQRRRCDELEARNKAIEWWWGPKEKENVKNYDEHAMMGMEI